MGVVRAALGPHRARRHARRQALPPHAIAALGLQLVPEERRIFGSLNVEENLVLAGLTAKARWPLDRVWEIFPRLQERRRSRGTDLSGGEQQMLAIARALMRDPKIDPARRAVRGAGADHRARPARDLPHARRGRADDRRRRAEHLRRDDPRRPRLRPQQRPRRRRADRPGRAATGPRCCTGIWGCRHRGESRDGLCLVTGVPAFLSPLSRLHQIKRFRIGEIG